MCRDLGIIPNDYPKQVCAMKHTRYQLSPPDNVTEHTTPPKSSRAKHTPFITMDASDRRSHTRKELLDEFNDVFSTSDELKTMTGEPMKIQLKENVETFAISTTRTIPFAWRDGVKENLDRMKRQGIVKPLGDSPTRWCHTRRSAKTEGWCPHLCRSHEAQHIRASTNSSNENTQGGCL